MDEFRFLDVLAGREVFVAADGMTARAADAVAPDAACESLFFPGCSLVNYAPALVAVLADYLAGAGTATSTSLLCCGKILDYEEDGRRRRDAFDERLRKAVAKAGVRRFVVACPNCAAALRRAFEGVDDAPEVAALPRVLAEMGCRIDEDAVRRVLAAKGFSLPEGRSVRLWVHDSCPDRGVGDFARGVRALLPEGSVANDDPAQAAGCCGSTARAAGKEQAALAAGRRRAETAADAGADALVTACMSCAASLTTAQDDLPVIHYLELLCDYPLDWRALARPMALRFLLEDDEASEAHTPSGGEAGRPFINLAPSAKEAL
ncbi:hypothetical protein GMI69_02665 [Eggerthellaceae bacterium zg-887]|uniref:(Fe-S)-binding protein n=1 Tax=Xiamenia xianingshaonis TaxID=2682776 RepID=UPI00140E8B84|nr:(Fe-S)-binding protein [Xiamenia xianingshaonis]NHM15576.1 hypothetical protein [Xiamenia xianingshaonis]